MNERWRCSEKENAVANDMKSATTLVRVGRLELPAGRASVGRAERRMASLAPGLRPEPLGDANWRPGVLSARLKDSEASRQMAARL